MSRNHIHNNCAYLWPVLLIIVIFVGSGSHDLATPDLGFQFHIDKIAHILVFGLVATLIIRTPKFNDLSLQSVLTTTLITSVYGACDEFRQSLTPTRSVEFADWLADTFGAFAAVTLYAKWHWYRRLLEWRKPIKREHTTESNGDLLRK
ncbi:MAG: VanZ family protein [Verrucomicrobiota bacterium]|nr:VanZ family protein [Verrucomicrobiota bacterium]